MSPSEHGSEHAHIVPNIILFLSFCQHTCMRLDDLHTFRRLTPVKQTHFAVYIASTGAVQA